MRISDWSSDVCSSDLAAWIIRRRDRDVGFGDGGSDSARVCRWQGDQGDRAGFACVAEGDPQSDPGAGRRIRLSAQGSAAAADRAVPGRSEEHTSELQSLMRISYAVFCLKKKK